ncbi:hypothetical protein WDU94_002858 [Cyamophila willieti]
MIQCDIKPGCKTLQRPNQCCPDYQCDCVHNGKLYNNGQRLDSTLTPCQACYCRGGALMCTTLTCYTRDDCEGKVQPGSCCPSYDHCPPLDLSRKGNDPIRNTKREMQPWFMTSPRQPSITSAALPVETNVTTQIYNEHTDSTTPLYSDYQTTDHINIGTKEYQGSMTTTNSDMEPLTTTIVTNEETEYGSKDTTNTTQILDMSTDQINTDSTESIRNVNARIETEDSTKSTSTEIIDTRTDMSARLTELSVQEDNVENRGLLDETTSGSSTTEYHTQNTESSTFFDQSTTEPNIISSVLTFINAVTANMARENSTTVADVTNSVITSTPQITEPSTSTESNTNTINASQTYSTLEPQSGVTSDLAKEITTTDKPDIFANKQETMDTSSLKERSADFIIAKLTNITRSLIKTVNDRSSEEVQKVDDGDATDILIESKSKLESSEDIVILKRKNEAKGDANTQNVNFRRINDNGNYEIDGEKKQIMRVDLNVTLPPDIEEEMLKLSQILLENSEKQIVLSNKKEELSHVDSGYKKIVNDKQSNEKESEPVTAHKIIEKRNTTDDKNSTKSKEEDSETSKNSDSTGGTGLDAQTQQDLLSSSSDSGKNSEYSVNHFEQLEADPISTFTVALEDEPNGFTTDSPDNFKTDSPQNSDIDLMFVAITSTNVDNKKNKESIKIEESSTDSVTSTTDFNVGVEELTTFQSETTTFIEGTTTTTEYYFTTTDPTTTNPTTTDSTTTNPTTTDPTNTDHTTTDPTTTDPTTTDLTTTDPTTTDQSTMGNLETTTESMLTQTTNIFDMTTTSTDTNTESVEERTVSTIVGEQLLQGPTMPSNEWKIEIVPTLTQNIELDNSQLVKTDGIKYDLTITSSNKSPSLRDTSSSEELDSKEDRSGESGSFNAQEIPGLLLNSNFPYLELGGFHISTESKSKNKTKSNLKATNETDNLSNKQKIKQLIKDNQHLIIVNQGATSKESNEEEAIEKFATELAKLLNEGPPKETTTSKSLGGQQMYRLRDRVGDRLQIATKDILDQIMAEDRDTSDDTIKIMSTRSTKLASEPQIELYESVERSDAELNEPCVDCSELAVDSGVTRSEIRNVSPIKLIKFDENKGEDVIHYGRKLRMNSKQTKMIDLISENNQIKYIKTQENKIDSNFNGKDNETIPKDVKADDETTKETTKQSNDYNENKIPKKSNDKDIKESNEIDKEKNTSPDEENEDNMDKFGHTLESPNSLFQIKTERVEEKAEPKLFYDSEKFKKPPEIVYPEEYPEAFQYINSPPLLIVTTTVYTSVPDVQFVTTQMTNLGLSYDYLTEEYKGDKMDNETTKSTPKILKSDVTLAKSDVEIKRKTNTPIKLKNESLTQNVFKNETLTPTPKENGGRNRSALIRSINDLSLEDDSDIDNPFETDYKNIEILRKSGTVSLKSLDLEDIDKNGDHKDSLEVKNLNNLLPHESIDNDEIKDKNTKSKRLSANAPKRNLTGFGLNRTESRNKINKIISSASLTNNIKEKTKDSSNDITIQKSVTKVVRHQQRKRENRKRLNHTDVPTTNTSINPVNLQTNHSEQLTSPTKRNNARKMILEDDAEWLIHVRPTKEIQSVIKSKPENIDAEWITPRDANRGRESRERGRDTERGRGIRARGRQVPMEEEQEAEWITPRDTPKFKTGTTKSTTENIDAEWIPQGKRTQSRRIPQERKRVPLEVNSEDVELTAKDKTDTLNTRTTTENSDAEWIPQPKRLQGRRIPEETKRYPQEAKNEDEIFLSREKQEAKWIKPRETKTVEPKNSNTNKSDVEWITKPNRSHSKRILLDIKPYPQEANGTSSSQADNLNKDVERTPKHILPQDKPKSVAKIVNRGRSQERQLPQPKNVGVAEWVAPPIKENQRPTVIDPVNNEKVLLRPENQEVESHEQSLPQEIQEKAESRTISRSYQEPKRFTQEANTQDETSLTGADSLNKDGDFVAQPIQSEFKSFPQELNTDREWIPKRILPQEKTSRGTKIVNRGRSQERQLSQSKEVGNVDWVTPPIQEKQRPRVIDPESNEKILLQDNQEVVSHEERLPQEIKEKVESRLISGSYQEPKRFTQVANTQDGASLSEVGILNKDELIAQPIQREFKSFPQEVNTDTERIPKRIIPQEKTNRSTKIVNRGRSQERQLPQPKKVGVAEWVAPPIKENQRPTDIDPVNNEKVLLRQENQEVESHEQSLPQEIQEKAESRTISRSYTQDEASLTGADSLNRDGDFVAQPIQSEFKSFPQELNTDREWIPKRILPQEKTSRGTKIVSRARSQERQLPQSKEVGNVDWVTPPIQEKQRPRVIDPESNEKILLQDNQEVVSHEESLPQGIQEKVESRLISGSYQEPKRFTQAANTQDGASLSEVGILNKDELIAQPIQPEFKSFPQEVNNDMKWIAKRIVPQEKTSRVAKFVNRERTQGRQVPQSKEVGDAEWVAPPIQEMQRPTHPQSREEIIPRQENQEIERDEQISSQEIQEIEEAELRTISRINEETKGFPYEARKQYGVFFSSDIGTNKDVQWTAQPKQRESKQFPQGVHTDDMEWVPKRIQDKPKRIVKIVNRGRIEETQFPQPQPEEYEKVEWINPPIQETQRPNDPANGELMLRDENQQFESDEQILPQVIQEFGKAESGTILKSNKSHRSKKPTDLSSGEQNFPQGENEDFDSDEQFFPEEIQEIEQAESITLAKTNHHRSRKRYSQPSQEYPQEALNIDLKKTYWS